MAWVFLLTAGLLEVAWAAGIKAATEKFSVGLGVLTLGAMIVSLAALYFSMTKLPLGVAYPIWTGIGSVGAVAVSVFYFGQPIGTTGLIGVGFLLAGMFLLGLETHP